MSIDLFEVRDIDSSKGRGMFARVDLKAQSNIFTTHPDIATLYTDFAEKACHQCFKVVEKGQGGTCGACKQFSMCTACQGSDRGQEAEAHHAQVCQWFKMLPEDVQKGDTDYLRFCLEYAARVQNGDSRVAMAVTDCCTNAESQSQEVKQFCESYAKLITSTFGPKGMVMDKEHLRDTLLRVKSNSLGFPYNQTATMGWAMQGEICMMNHSCNPNCALLQTKEDGKMFLVTIRDVAEGEELCLSYVNLPEYQDVKIRCRELLEKYRFLCRCEVCEGQRAGTWKEKVGARVPTTTLASSASTSTAATAGGDNKQEEGDEKEQAMKMVD